MFKRLLVIIGLSLSLNTPASAMFIFRTGTHAQDEQQVQKVMDEVKNKNPKAYKVIKAQLQFLTTRMQELEAQGSLIHTTVNGCFKIINLVIKCGLIVSGVLFLIYALPLINATFKNGNVSREDLDKLVKVIRCDAFRALCKLPFGTCSVPWSCSFV